MLELLDMDVKNKIPFISNIRLSCNFLKITACIIMALDHFAYGVLHNYLKVHAMDMDPSDYTNLNSVYEVLHSVGRIAFPIFCFFLVEGFLRTRNVYKYALRLMIFAIITEIPFDLGLYGVIFKGDHQNILITFFIALLMLITLRFLEGNIWGLSEPVVILTYICTVIAFSDVAYLIHADYSWKCMLLVAVLYFARSDTPLRLIAGAAATSWEKYGPISFVLLYFYDPEVRPRFKYAFYFFYPVHLMLIYLIAKFVI